MGRTALPIYLDHAATTPVAPEVLADMLPYFSETFANPAAIYGPGAEARDGVEEARETIAEFIGATPEEVFFTSGGTESDNWAIKGMAASVGACEKRHILTTPIEHRAVLEPCQSLTQQGFCVEYLPVDSVGRVDPEDVRARLRPETLLVSVMHANNEIGTIEPIAQIGAICRERGVAFHSDAVQTLGKLPMDVRRLDADLVSISAHKLYGPKGIGALYVRRGLRIGRFHEGGEQERGRRAGTLNVPGIVGFGSAVRLARQVMDREAVALAELRDRLIDGVLNTIPGAELSGPRYDRLPNNAHFCFQGVEGEPLLLALDMAGICASAGSACTAGSTEPSHVLLAMGLEVERARGALRLTLGRSTTEQAVDCTAERLAQAVHDLRALNTAAVAAGAVRPC